MSKRSARKPLAEPAYVLFLAFVGLALGTVLLPQTTRLALLSLALAMLCLIYRANHELPGDFVLARMGRGALLGLVMSLPVLAFLPEPLRLFTERLYGTQDAVFIFYQVCFVSAPVEEFFFRGILHSRLGSSWSIACYALTGALYFAPHVPATITLIVFFAMGLLGLIYSAVYERHGLAAAIACHVVVVFVLQVAPELIVAVRSLPF